MNVFRKISDAIFGSNEAEAATTPAEAPETAATSQAAPGGHPAQMTTAQVEERIRNIASRKQGQFNWQTSIVDLMKVLDLDSSLANRKELANELGYRGELDGSAETNTWLHRELMRQLAQNGGYVPETLKSSHSTKPARGKYGI